MEQDYQNQLKKQDELNSKIKDELGANYKENISKISEQFEEAK